MFFLFCHRYSCLNFFLEPKLKGCFVLSELSKVGRLESVTFPLANIFNQSTDRSYLSRACSMIMSALHKSTSHHLAIVTQCFNINGFRAAPTAPKITSTS